jgi:dTMP kinase
LGEGEWNRLDQETVEFHRRVRRGYQELIAVEPKRWLVVDVCRSIEEVQREIQRAVRGVLEKKVL